MNSRRMQAIQPKIRELQEKYAGDQAKIGTELLELYKREKVNPLGSCLPLVIQMPILIVLYSVIREINDVSNYYFLYPVLSGFDVQTIDTHFLWVNLMAIGGTDAAILAVVVWAVQFVQMKLSIPPVPPSTPEKEKVKDGHEVPPSLTPDPATMNRFMVWGMPVVLAVTTFFFPLGIAIYWIVGSLFMIAQQAVVNRKFPKNPAPQQ